jgi:type IV secretory pathway TraG/TraD family ATPase VirD4
MKSRNAIMLLLFAILYAGGLFMESEDFVNRQVTSKWHWAVWCTAISFYENVKPLTLKSRQDNVPKIPFPKTLQPP